MLQELQRPLHWEREPKLMPRRNPSPRLAHLLAKPI
jgi:hypothetical protein